MEFYHISMDISSEKEKEFIPRIPFYRCELEDGTIPRICVCKKLEEAISAFPYKSLFVNKSMRTNMRNYLAMYKIESNDYILSEELKDYIPDVHLTNECWITSPVKARTNLIKIKDLRLRGFNKYINEYYGQVSLLDYENSIENYERVEEYVLLSKGLLNKFKKITEKENIKLEILEDEHNHLGHYYTFLCSTKNYRWIKVKLTIPPGADLTAIWHLDDKQNKFLYRKNLIVQKAKKMTIEEYMDELHEQEMRDYDEYIEKMEKCI